MKLKEYLDSTGIPIARFAKRCGLTYPQVRYILNGNSPTLETAFRIEAYTEGQVDAKDLLPQESFTEIEQLK